MDDAPSAPGPGCADVRCGCGSLLARYVDGGVELKCRRCKRVWCVPVEGDAPVPAATGARRPRAPGGAGP